MSARLGVNVDHVATIRNARGGAHPDPFAAALVAVGAGADGITAHLREDRRHVRDGDLERIAASPEIRLNFEMAGTDEMVAIALRLRPAACCIVPERREEVTTEGGLDAFGQAASLGPKIAALKGAGIRVSLFLAPDPAQLDAAARLGAEVVELHTGAYAEGGQGELERLRAGAAHLRRLGLECHAGHGLTYANVLPIAAFPEVEELNIGHFLIGQAVMDGLPGVIKRMKALIASARG
ncbi:MAG: pyridoxine 5'-phosphate synthase [Acetobacteraceae bacterium]|nr:pyridoxine 5'-phosphate synthase [Acetobacteraceae bacterium]